MGNTDGGDPNRENLRGVGALPLGAGVGTVLGAGVGSALGHIAIGAGIGTALGTAVGVIFMLTCRISRSES